MLLFLVCFVFDAICLLRWGDTDRLDTEHNRSFLTGKRSYFEVTSHHKALASLIFFICSKKRFSMLANVQYARYIHILCSLSKILFEQSIALLK